jgi:hypothetical protein
LSYYKCLKMATTVGKRGPACSICTHSKRAAIEVTYRTENIKHTASRFGVGHAPLERHRRLCLQLSKAEIKAALEGAPTVKEPKTGSRVRLPAGDDAPPQLPNLPPGASLEDQMRAHSRYLQERIQWETSYGDGRAIAQLSGQYTNAQRHLAKLTGALEVSEQQIVRSPKFTRLLGLITEALGNDHKTIAKVLRAVEIYQNGESQVR